MRVLVILVLATAFLRAAEPLTAIDGCTLVPTEWADGDSFLVRTPAGTEHTVRLYGVDCIEWHVGDDSDARRLRSQRRYFGISGFGGSPQASITKAKEFGGKAGARTAELLASPFTVHTAFSDARGDGRHKRIYGFVTTHTGDDLAARLVREGLARAYGVFRQNPALLKADDYRAQLRDLELQAAKKGQGVWQHTDWDKLPGERQLERTEEADLSLAVTGKEQPDVGSINPNTAARDELMRLPGIGEVTANRIIEKRPYVSMDDLTRVTGIGPKTLERIRPFLTSP